MFLGTATGRTQDESSHGELRIQCHQTEGRDTVDDLDLTHVA